MRLRIIPHSPFLFIPSVDMWQSTSLISETRAFVLLSHQDLTCFAICYLFTYFIILSLCHII